MNEFVALRLLWKINVRLDVNRFSRFNLVDALVLALHMKREKRKTTTDEIGFLPQILHLFPPPRWTRPTHLLRQQLGFFWLIHSRSLMRMFYPVDVLKIWDWRKCRPFVYFNLGPLDSKTAKLSLEAQRRWGVGGGGGVARWIGQQPKIVLHCHVVQPTHWYFVHLVVFFYC